MTEKTDPAPRTRICCSCCKIPLTASVSRSAGRCDVCTNARCTPQECRAYRLLPAALAPLRRAARSEIGHKRGREPAEPRQVVALTDIAEPARARVVQIQRSLAAAATAHPVEAGELMALLLQKELLRLDWAVIDADWARAQQQYTEKRAQILARLGALYLAYDTLE